jgi:RHS repeat-associated protein
LAIDENSGSGWLTIQASDREYPFIFKRAKIYVGCWTCGESGDCNGPAGNGFVQLSSVDVRLSLGKAGNGVPAGNILLKSDIPSPDLATPKMLEFSSFVKGVEARYNNGMLRQVLAPKTFVDVQVIDDFAFAVNFYDPAVVTGETDGLYTFDSAASPVASWKFENPDRTKDALTRLTITETKECGPRSYEYQWDAGSNGWTLTRGNGLKIETASTEYTQNEWIETRTITDGQGNIASKIKTAYARFAWGEGVSQMVNDPDGAALTTTYAYDDQGRITQQTDPDGSWTRYTYDGQGKIATRITPWLDAPPDTPESQARAVYYDYTPVDPADTALPDDLYRPRAITEKIVGQTTARTFYSYRTDSGGARTEITEQCIRPDAAFGDPANLRTTRIWYPAGTGSADSGKIRSIQYADGRLDTYAYENVSGSGAGSIFGDNQSSGAFLETVVRGSMDHPAGIPFKTEKAVAIRDEFGNAILEETHVYTGAGYEKVTWTERLYDENGRMIEEAKFDGTRTEKSWSFCHLQTETDRLGLTTGYAYDQLGRTASITRPGPAGMITTTYTYDAGGRRLSETTTAEGLILTSATQYDTAGRIVGSTDPSGLTTTYDYSADNRTTTVIRPGGAIEITERYRDGRVKHVHGAGTIERYYEYGVNADGTQWTEIRTEGQDSALWEKTTTDVLGRTVREERPAFDGTIAVTTHEYDVLGRLVKTRTPGRADILYVYDALGQIEKTGLDVDNSEALEPASMDRITRTETAYVNLNGDWWQQSEQQVFGADHTDLATSTGATRTRLTGLGINGMVHESVSIDLFGNQTVSRSHIDPAARTETRTIAYPDSEMDVQSVSVNGFLTSSTSKTGLTLTYGYDALGRRTEVTDPRTGTSVTHYDARDRVDYVQDAAGHRTTFTYDPATGRKTAETNALGNVTRYAYNIRGQVTHTWGDSTYPVAYDYDAFGRMTQMITYRADASWSADAWPSGTTGDTTTWDYDEATGLLLSKTDAAGNAVTYAYDAAGQLSTRVWARTENGTPLATDYIYDPATGDLTGIDYSDETPDISFTHDRLGRHVAITDAAGSRTFAYNENLQLTSETLSGLINRTLARTYDAFGRDAGFTAGPGSGPGHAVTYGYDALGRFKTVAWNIHGQTDAVTYTYLPDADLLAGYATSGLSTAYTYEPHRNLKTRIENARGAQLISGYDYQYDPLGRRTSVINTGSAFALEAFNNYAYNPRNELMESQRFMGADPDNITQPVDPEYRAYDYDPIGNRNSAMQGSESSIYTANSLNQYDAVDGRSLTYDDDGNQTRLPASPGISPAGGDMRLTWNAENRLVMVEPITPAAGDVRVGFVYDYMGRRVKKAVSAYNAAGGDWTPAEERLFVYDGWNLIEEITITMPAGTESSRCFVWGLDLSQSLQGAGGIGGLIAVVDGLDTYYFAYDGNGNVGQVIDAAFCAIAASYQHDPFGNLIKSDGAYANDNPFRFSTKYHDDETGFVYYGYRYYMPELGRWISRDPLATSGGLNLYAFIKNNPYKRVDPFGLYGRDVHLGLTYFLAEKAGLCKETAEQIAKWNQAVDDDFDTSPIFSYILNAWYGYIPIDFLQDNFKEAMHAHFPSKDYDTKVVADSAYVRRLMTKALDGGSLEAISRNLHTFQDSFSHAGYTVNHILDTLFGTDPDATWINGRSIDGGRDIKMAERTYDYLIELNKRIKNNEIEGKWCCEPIPFKDFKSEIMGYLQESAFLLKEIFFLSQNIDIDLYIEPPATKTHWELQMERY